MATREENLKKINSELERMSDEQLEQVAGGWCHIKKHCCSINEQNPDQNNGDGVNKMIIA